MAEQGGFVPVPDPTLLTTQQLNREIQSLKDLFDCRLDELAKRIEVNVGTLQRLEKTVDDHQAFAVTTAIKVNQLAVELKGFQDYTTTAGNKSDNSVSKQIDSLATILATTSKAIDDKITDLKDRVTRTEGRGEGTIERQATHQASFSNVTAVVGLIAAIIFGIAGFVIGAMKH